MSPTIRPLTQPEQHAFAAARLRAVEHAPYLARALFAVTPLAADDLGTMAVDPHWRLYLDPDTMTQWGPANSAGVLIHEVGHLVRDHAGRARDLPGRYDHDLWNASTDAALNDDQRAVLHRMQHSAGSDPSIRAGQRRVAATASSPLSG